MSQCAQVKPTFSLPHINSIAAFGFVLCFGKICKTSLFSRLPLTPSFTLHKHYLFYEVSHLHSSFSHHLSYNPLPHLFSNNPISDFNSLLSHLSLELSCCFHSDHLRAVSKVPVCSLSVLSLDKRCHLSFTSHNMASRLIILYFIPARGPFGSK